ncbi:MAG: leucine-rich repeat domain-containing protein [Saprospiraceae bacterium]|nr:leucine-rich repeat domain-containing protein [Saprospiraceae bacterium]
MRILVILTLTISAFAYGWMHQEINVSPNYSSTKHRPAIFTEATELPDGDMLSFEKLNFACDRRSDSLELVKFYNATGGPNWWKKWNFSKPMDTWWGITLNSIGCILSINLSDTTTGSCCKGNNLTGPIISLDLPNMEYLFLNNNQLSGGIPDFDKIPNLKQLYLNNNFLSGNIPNFSHITNLFSLGLSNNNLSGFIPDFNMLPNLSAYLYLGNNNLTGSIPNFDKIPEISQIFLDHNQLSGNIPNFANLTKLRDLDLNNNRLVGQLPSFENCSSLKNLFLNDNLLTGNIPNFESNKNLVTIDLSNNNLVGNIPNFNNHSELFNIILSNNKLFGSIPSFLNCTNLTNLYLDKNRLDGNIPTFDQNLNLSRLLINNNLLKGYISDFTVTNPKLSWLRFDQNRFSYSEIIQNLEKVKKLVDSTNMICSTCKFDTLLYAPQQKIYFDTSFQILTNTPYTLDLLIDDTISTSTYTWYKNGTLYKTIKGKNKLHFAPFTTTDAGTYTVKITNPLAPQLTLESWPIRLNAGPSLVCDRRSDSLELVKFYNATGGPNWTIKWELNKAMNTWYGISLSADGCVQKIDFIGISNNLSGILIQLNLSHLTFLNLSYNQLSGSIPNFDKLPNLQNLYLDRNQLTGSIPNFDKLPNLLNLSLTGNQLTESIPNFDKLPSLQFLNLGYNQLTGLIPNFDKLPSLKSLHLSGNRLIGSIPNFDKLPNLESLGLFENQLSGYLPDHTLTNPKLDGYRIDQNKLTFSSFIRNIKKVKTLTDVLNNLCPTCSGDTLTYAPQKMIYVDTSIFIPVNTRYTLDLLIDDTVTTSSYAWYKNGTLYKTIKGSNKLPFTPFTSADAGTYTVKITNPLAPQLTLESWPIRLNAGPRLVCDRRSDSLELVKFYNATGGLNWWKKWDLSKPMSTWWGIKQSGEGCITGIYLSDTANLTDLFVGNNLSGIMIDLNLPHLLELNLASNKLGGNIPNFNGFPSLTSIHLFNNKFNGLIPDFDNLPLLLDLNFGSNSLSGNIPSLNKLTKLRNISLFSNILSGPLPAFDKALSLESIQIQSNKLDGSLPSLKNPILRLIYLHHNNFSGPIPSFDFTPNLETLNVTDNKLTGIIPDFKNLPLLKDLLLQQNLLSGSLPQLKSCLLLKYFGVQNNRLDGQIPDLSHLKNLVTLTLSDNKFSGPVPKLDKYPNLKEVWLANNNFTGSLEDYTISNPLLSRGTFEGNKLTFSNIIKYHDKIKTLIEVTNKWSQSLFSYAPQQKIYVDTAITIPPTPITRLILK